MIDTKWRPAEMLHVGHGKIKEVKVDTDITVHNDSGYPLVIQFDETGRRVRILSKLEDDE